jgi:HAD superfamily hydrolase (TIGR01484 family)
MKYLDFPAGDLELIAFDLDGTLAESKMPIEQDIIDCLVKLCDYYKIAIISGCKYEQMLQQFLAHIPKDLRCSFYLMPTCGGRLYVSDGDDLAQIYNTDLNSEDKASIITVWSEVMAYVGLNTATDYGPIIEDRGGQITFSMCGQDAPLEVKRLWDPDFEKRKEIWGLMSIGLPDFKISIGGTSSIDVTPEYLDKAYGITKLLEYMNGNIEHEITRDNILFVGDSIFPNGNDWAVKRAGVACIETNSPKETVIIINKLLEGADENLGKTCETT